MSVFKLPLKDSVASFDVDAQNTFTPLCADELPVPDGHTIVAQLNAQAKLASIRIGSKDAHSDKAIWIADDEHPIMSEMQARNVDRRWPTHAVPGTFGFELIAGLPKVEMYDYFIWKGVELDMHPYGACYHDMAEKLSTGVIEFLINRQISTVIVGGLAFDYCVKTTVLQLLKAGFNVVINRAATRAIAKKSIDLVENELAIVGCHFVDGASEMINDEE